MSITSWVLGNFGGFWLWFRSDFTRFSNVNNFFNFEAINFYHHLNESPGSPLSYSPICRLLPSVGQKIGRGLKWQTKRKSLK